ncbi:hypothetical protein LOD99_3324 [Oopsacas minuta]|uniref:D-arabinono-1,4-lactone oxidase n=1 Tax=Oopsacas minuta TaxID=111878 RepID=A0AAV7JYQ9_9METZ|nr:hypothetical protein LOD99_3324 [Oopsacas minuta]
MGHSHSHQKRGADHPRKKPQTHDTHGERIHLEASFLTERISHLKGKSISEIVELFKEYFIEFPENELVIELDSFEKRFDIFIKWLAGIENPKIATEPSEFINWSETQKIKESYICSPRNKAGIIEILNHPEYKGRHIGLLGSTHSWDNLYGNDGSVLLNFLLFKGPNGKAIEKVNIDEGIINISAGCSILQKHGLLGISKDPILLPNCVIFTDGHYAGFTATGCHGCSFTEGSVSDRIRKITFLDAEGKENVLDIDKDEKKLRAGAIGLGSYGIITELQFKMEREKLVVTESHYWTLSQMKYHLHNRPIDWISFEHYWWPFGSVSLGDAFQCMITGTLENYDFEEDKVYCRIVRHYRDPNNHERFPIDPITNKSIPYWDEFSKSYIYPDEEYKGDPFSIGKNEFPYYFQEVLLWLRKYVFKHFENKHDHPHSGYLQRFTPFFQVLILELLKGLQFIQEFGRPRVSTFFNAVHYLPFVSALPVRINDIELCFKASSQPACEDLQRESFDNYFKALNELGVRIQDEAYYGRFPVNMCIESRICAASPCPLAACYSTEPKLFVYLEILSFLDTPSWKYFGNEFFRVIKSIDPNVKPALGKQWALIEGIHEHLREVCKEGLAGLKELQQEYDKAGRFMSPVIVDLFN